jgi:hypothetical protein
MIVVEFPFGTGTVFATNPFPDDACSSKNVTTDWTASYTATNCAAENASSPDPPKWKVTIRDGDKVKSGETVEIYGVILCPAVAGTSAKFVITTHFGSDGDDKRIDRNTTAVDVTVTATPPATLL